MSFAECSYSVGGVFVCRSIIGQLAVDIPYVNQSPRVFKEGSDKVRLKDNHRSFHIIKKEKTYER